MRLTPLHAGPLTLAFDSINGSIRYLFAGEHEVLRGINAPVRDAYWLTIAPRISDVNVRQNATDFSVTFDADCQSDSIAFRWRGTIRGEADGTLTFEFDGEALRDSVRNRIGFCVLHPAEAAGAALIVEHTDGRREVSALPSNIAPHQPFFDLRALTHEYASGQRAEVHLEGDTFEMEDQRNWTDASFKTYCTPLARPFPVTLEAGTRIRQRVTLRLLNAVPLSGPAVKPRWAAGSPVELVVSAAAAGTLPALGTLWRGAPSSGLVGALRSLQLAHLRIDLWLGGTSWRSTLRDAATAAGVLETALELAVHVDDKPVVALHELRDALADLQPTPKIARWLVFQRGHSSTPAECIETWREVFAGTAFAAPVGGGATENFTELNRGREVANVADFTIHACNPQVHASDDASVIETLPIQGATVLAARQLSGGRPAIVSPVTLTPRQIIPSGDAADALPAALMPHRFDARLTTQFAAAWTLGSLAALAGAGAASVTYFEAHGENGLIGLDARPRPIQTLFELLAPLRSARMWPVAISHPLSMAALGLEFGSRRILMIATFSATQRSVQISGAWGIRQLTVGPEPAAFEL